MTAIEAVKGALDEFDQAAIELEEIEARLTDVRGQIVDLSAALDDAELACKS